MLNYRPISTPLDTRAKLSSTDDKLVTDGSTTAASPVHCSIRQSCAPTSLMPSNKLASLCMIPVSRIFSLSKWIRRYVQSTTHLGLRIHNAASSHDLVANSAKDWADCSDTRPSTYGFCMYVHRTKHGVLVL